MHFLLAVVMFVAVNLAKPILYIGLGMAFGWFIELVTGSFIPDAVWLLTGVHIDMLHLGGLLGLLVWVAGCVVMVTKGGE